MLGKICYTAYYNNFMNILRAYNVCNKQYMFHK